MTAAYAAVAGGVSTVSNRRFGTVETGDSAEPVLPARSCQAFVSVVPFQLAYSLRSRATRAGASAGRPLHGKRNVR